MRKVLLDTNKIVKIINKEALALQWFLDNYNEDVIFYTTPLIRHEVLRYYGLDQQNAYSKAENFLSALEIINIEKSITDIATHIVRYEKTKYPERYQTQTDGNQKRIDKYNFDIMYVATAQYLNLETSSDDSDICKYTELYNESLVYSVPPH